MTWLLVGLGVFAAVLAAEAKEPATLLWTVLAACLFMLAYARRRAQ